MIDANTRKSFVGLGDITPEFAKKVAAAQTIGEARALWGSVTPGTAQELMARGNLERLCSRALAEGGDQMARVVATHAPADSMYREIADRVLNMRLPSLGVSAPSASA